MITDRLITRRRLVRAPGLSTSSTCTGRRIVRPIAGNAGRWLDHIDRLYRATMPPTSSTGARIACSSPPRRSTTRWCSAASRASARIRLLEPVKHAVGAWNFNEVSPQQVLGRFNGFLKSVILRVSEARDLGDFDRFAFYDHMKAYHRGAARRAAHR